MGIGVADEMTCSEPVLDTQTSIPPGRSKAAALEIAAKLAHRSKGQPVGYRNYLYSSRGYRKLRRQCGFSACACYVALPSYNDPKFYLPLESNVFAYMSRNFAASRSGLRRAVRECLVRLGLLQHLEYSFAVLATK